MQGDFDAASAAFEAGKCAEAEPIFARLAADLRVKPGTLPAAMIALRRGRCRIGEGDTAQGEAWVREGLPVVEQAGPDLVGDAAAGWIALARLATRNYDHDGAVEAYRHVLAMPGQADRLDALLGLAVVTAFDGDGAALPLTDHALTVVAANPAGHDRSRNEAAVRTIRARILMNLGRNDQASNEAETALTLAGGLTSRVSLNDVSLRSDAASRQITDQSNSVATDVIRGSSCPPKWRLFSRNSARITCGVTGLAMGGTQIPDPISPLANRYRCHRCRPRSLVVSP